MSQSSGFFEAHRSSLRDQVMQAIRAAISSGELRPGDRINESQIAERMKVSKAPVREALRLLENSSLVSTIPNKGSFVAKLGVQDTCDIFGIRSAAEHLAVSLVIDHRNLEVLDEMQAAVEEMRKAELQGNIERVSQADHSFHELLVTHSGNQRLVRIWKEMDDLMKMLRLHEDLHAIRLTGAVEHEIILEAIRNGDKARARSLLEDHIRGAREQLISVMGR
jgi:DNA-binding GntR family transcriptional regulator